ncbi:unnamed protein product [Caenorhabditis sp. 36 PRJEB53466]|nr:unnamed protein product [Caenorhabditis sp. 36 PRJEB53466]
MRSSKGSRSRAAVPKTAPTTVCYCDGKRELGSVEVVCSTCLKWFHGRCLNDYGGLTSSGVPFMTCYTFTCKMCRPLGEEWKPKKADLVQMCVTVFAKLSADKLNEVGKLSADIIPEDLTFLSLNNTIVPYMDENWHMLTAIKKRHQWHSNLAVILQKERNVFVQNESDEDLFALAEKNLALLGPLHEAVKQIQIGKRPASEREVREPRHVELPPIEGPKTRGASKRRHAEGATAPGKKQKLAADYSSTAIPGGAQVDIPFSKDNYRYFLTETDPNVPEDTNWHQDNTGVYKIPSAQYRVLLNPTVTVSSNDRAFQLSLGPQNAVTGFEGYAMARASHGISKGTWYFEVNFDEQPGNSAIRIGWSQQHAVLQACCGYNKFSYGWRSQKGTKFHDGKGKTYYPAGFKAGDILGCLIHFPVDDQLLVPLDQSSETYLPSSFKDANLINFKSNLFFEVQGDSTVAVKHLVPVPGSYVEFFHNGKSCGKAFENIFGGTYFPSVSIFQRASVTMNFGPKFKSLPRGAQGMHARAEEQQYEQSLSDILYLVAKDHVNLRLPVKNEPKQEIY